MEVGLGEKEDRFVCGRRCLVFEGGSRGRRRGCDGGREGV